MNERFEIVIWPNIQNYMDKEGFEDNSFLINNEIGLNKYGSSAYLIDSNWKREIDEEFGDFEPETEYNFALDEKVTIWRRNSFTVQAKNIQHAQTLAKLMYESGDVLSDEFEYLYGTEGSTGESELICLTTGDTLIPEG